MNQGTKYTYVDLFCGAGGMTEGFEASNKFEGLAHIDWEIPMVRTLRHRLKQIHNLTEEDAKRKVIHMDLQLHDQLLYGIKDEHLADTYKNNHPDFIKNGLVGSDHAKGILGNRKVDVVIGGPSCQAYSIAGRAQDENGMKKDYRNFLFESFVKIVHVLKPKIFIFENVPGILSAKPNDRLVTELIYEAFDSIGYKMLNTSKIKKALYDLSEYGVPQKRKRVIIIGCKKNIDGEDIIPLEKIYHALDEQKSISSKKTAGDAIGDLQQFRPLDLPIHRVSHGPLKSDESKNINNHVPRYHNPRDIEIFREWLGKNMNQKSSEDKLSFYNTNKNIQRKSTFSKHAKYRNIIKDEPSPTLVAHLHKDGLMFIHWDIDQARTLTVRECARLQSFPDDFEFLESSGPNYKMIGNAVPPSFAKILADTLIPFLDQASLDD
jgi:DNA (cytosine-5)-methyltransferase 1